MLKQEVDRDVALIGYTIVADVPSSDQLNDIGMSVGWSRALGYAEASAFIHAFSGWSGQTPDRWRRGPARTAAAQQP